MGSPSEFLCDGKAWGPGTMCFIQIVYVSLIPTLCVLAFGTVAIVRHILWRQKNLHPRAYLPVLEADPALPDTTSADPTNPDLLYAPNAATTRGLAWWTTLLNLCLLQLILVVARTIFGLREEPGYAYHLRTYDLVALVATIVQWSYVLAILSYLAYVKVRPDRPSLLAPAEKRKRQSVRWIVAFAGAQTACKAIQLGAVWVRYTEDHATKTALVFVMAQVFTSVLFLAVATCFSWPDPTVFGRRRSTPAFVPEESSHGLPLSDEEGASLLSKLSFAWHNKLIDRGYLKPLELSEIPDLLPNDKAANVCKQFEAIRPQHSTLLVSLYHLVRSLVWLQAAFAFVSSLLSFSGPFFLNRILAHVSQPQGTSSPIEGVLYAVALLICSLVRAACDGQVYFIGRRIGCRVRAVVIGEVYGKALRRRAIQGDVDDANASATTGQITNLMAVDTGKILESACYLIYFWAYPLQIVICTTLLVILLGWPALAGIGVMVTVAPIGGFLGKLVADKQKALIKSTDARITAMSELLQGIRIVKFFAWEKHYFKSLTKFRSTELDRLKSYLYTTAASRLVWFSAPILVSFLTFMSFTKLAGRSLTAEVAFTGLALFNALRDPLRNLPDMIVRYTEAFVSVRRIETFLREENLERYNPGQKAHAVAAAAAQTPVGFTGPAAFSWEAKPDKAKKSAASTPPASTTPVPAPFGLSNLEIAFPQGKLSLICGVTGHGKSSIILALLGEMNRTKGESYLPGPAPDGERPTVAYAAQQPWLMNASIRDNITFGQPYSHRKYQAVITACALLRDFETLEGGDMTEIGEKGVGLSGGQKARISLARAAYSEAAYVLLDDPLSAVDPPTAAHLFNSAILGLMKGKTIVLVTHAVHLCLPRADHVIVMKSGRVMSQGPPKDIIGKGPGKIDLETVCNDNDELEPVDESAEDEVNAKGKGSAAASTEDLEGTNLAVEVDLVSTTDSMAIEGDDGAPPEDRLMVRLIQDESRARGSVKSEVYWSYLGAAGGILFGIGLSVAYTSVQLSAIMTDWWLKQWAGAYRTAVPSASSSLTSSLAVLAVQTSDGVMFAPRRNPQHVDVDYYLAIYATIGGVSLVALLFRIIVVYSGSLRASRTLHNTMLAKLLRAPMRWFDVTPMGQTLNRFSKDTQTIDQEVASFSGEFLANAIAAVAVVILIAVISPTFVLALGPIAIIYRTVAKRYLRTSTELKRLDSITRSPIYSHFGETLVGAATIRAYGAEKRFMDESNARVDTNHRAFFYLWTSNRWLGIRVDFVGAMVSFSAAMAILASIHMGNGVMDPGSAGLSLSYALTFTDALLWVVRMHAVMEMSMNSVERVTEYLKIPQEAPAESTRENRPPANWPHAGRVEFRDLTARYAPDLSPVLNGVSFVAAAGEKVGLVGRTGAGKSTLSLALFRFLEADGGGIFVDGIDISTIGLDDLRGRLTIIPQDPVLFTGTVRSNLDPFGEHSDLALWTALRRAGLADPQPATSSSSAPTSPVTIGGGRGTPPMLSSGPSYASFSTSLVIDHKTGSLVARSIPPSLQATPASSRRTSLASPAAAADFFTAPSAKSGGGASSVGSAAGSIPHSGGGGRSGSGSGGGKPPAMPPVLLRRKSSAAVMHAPTVTLDMPIAEGGQNLSQGQRQLLCLARALLRSCKVIVLDEATASVDHETDARIQSTIRTEFRGATLLTVAHRIRTVADFDKILVLSQGRVAEFGAPSALMARPPLQPGTEPDARGELPGLFRAMCEESGDFAVLKEMARAADEERIKSRKRSVLSL
ncbi:hypothetical protein HDU90_008206 [Geranomyces variabilis]|nr:hypothetical protein HDU90_008206 [Geranomyces variabilis]